MSTPLIELSNALAQATDRAAASLVAVHTESRGSSSGIIWRSGVVVAAEHAMRRDDDIQVTLPNGRIVPARLAGRDPSTDLTVLKCEQAVAAVSDFGDAHALKPGSLALVVGRTRASGPVAALGVVSLVAPESRSWTGADLAPYIRLDVSLQPTAVGGAVVEASGQVAGLATPRFTRFGAVAVPVPVVNRVVDTLLQKGRIPQGYLGVGLQPIRFPETLSQSLRRPEKTAVIVLEMEPNAPAHKAGMVVGDILITLGGKPVARLEDVHAQLTPETIGQSLAAQFVRGGTLQETNIVVGERPHGGR
jgi:S1-C subfamily serine protease